MLSSLPQPHCKSAAPDSLFQSIACMDIINSSTSSLAGVGRYKVVGRQPCGLLSVQAVRQHDPAPAAASHEETLDALLSTLDVGVTAECAAPGSVGKSSPAGTPPLQHQHQATSVAAAGGASCPMTGAAGAGAGLLPTSGPDLSEGASVVRTSGVGAVVRHHVSAVGATAHGTGWGPEEHTLQRPRDMAPLGLPPLPPTYHQHYQHQHHQSREQEQEHPPAATFYQSSRASSVEEGGTPAPPHTHLAPAAHQPGEQPQSHTTSSHTTAHQHLMLPSGAGVCRSSGMGVAQMVAAAGAAAATGASYHQQSWGGAVTAAGHGQPVGPHAQAAAQHAAPSHAVHAVQHTAPDSAQQMHTTAGAQQAALTGGPLGPPHTHSVHAQQYAYTTGTAVPGPAPGFVGHSMYLHQHPHLHNAPGCGLAHWPHHSTPLPTPYAPHATATHTVQPAPPQQHTGSLASGPHVQPHPYPHPAPAPSHEGAMSTAHVCAHAAQAVTPHPHPQSQCTDGGALQLPRALLIELLLAALASGQTVNTLPLQHLLQDTTARDCGAGSHRGAPNTAVHAAAGLAGPEAFSHASRYTDTPSAAAAHEWASAAAPLPPQVQQHNTSLQQQQQQQQRAQSLPQQFGRSGTGTVPGHVSQPPVLLPPSPCPAPLQSPSSSCHWFSALWGSPVTPPPPPLQQLPANVSQAMGTPPLPGVMHLHAASPTAVDEVARAGLDDTAVGGVATACAHMVPNGTHTPGMRRNSTAHLVGSAEAGNCAASAQGPFPQDPSLLRSVEPPAQAHPPAGMHGPDEACAAMQHMEAAMLAAEATMQCLDPSTMPSADAAALLQPSMTGGDAGAGAGGGVASGVSAPAHWEEMLSWALDDHQAASGSSHLPPADGGLVQHPNGGPCPVSGLLPAHSLAPSAAAAHAALAAMLPIPAPSSIRAQGAGSGQGDEGCSVVVGGTPCAGAASGMPVVGDRQGSVIGQCVQAATSTCSSCGGAPRAQDVTRDRASAVKRSCSGQPVKRTELAAAEAVAAAVGRLDADSHLEQQALNSLLPQAKVPKVEMDLDEEAHQAKGPMNILPRDAMGGALTQANSHTGDAAPTQVHAVPMRTTPGPPATRLGGAAQVGDAPPQPTTAPQMLPRMLPVRLPSTAAAVANRLATALLPALLPHAAGTTNAGQTSASQGTRGHAGGAVANGVAGDGGRCAQASKDGGGAAGGLFALLQVPKAVRPQGDVRRGSTPLRSTTPAGIRPSAKPPAGMYNAHRGSGVGEEGEGDEGPEHEQEGDEGGEGGATDGGSPTRATKPHPQVERNRRDVINSLINRLRALVPASPDSPVTHYARGGDRRPKHAVLRETIALVEAMRTREASAAAQMQHLRAQLDMLLHGGANTANTRTTRQTSDLQPPGS